MKQVVDTFDATYPAGGESVLPSQLGLRGIDYASIGITTNGYVAQYLTATSKVKLWEGDYDPAAVGPLTQNATADVSAESVRLKFEGN